jgi:ubiquitin-protein ligase
MLRFCPDMFADLLTSDGWSSVYSIEAILLQIRMAMCVSVLCLYRTAERCG